jgi:hypothetical protein
VSKIIKITLMIVFMFSIKVSASSCLVFDKLNNQQKETLYKAYKYGETDGIGYSLAAIGWQESQAGKYLVNLSDPSFGVFAITIKTASKVEGIDEESFEANLLAQKLIFDFNYGMKMAKREILYWLNYHKEDWSRTWASYNAGFDTSNGIEYTGLIAGYVRVLQKCLPTYIAQKSLVNNNNASYVHYIHKKSKARFM